MIYFIRAPKSGMVKIGYSAGHPSVRLKSLQCGSAERLELIGMMDGERSLETEWHRRFAHLRQHGEWFSWNAEMRRAAKPYLWTTAQRKIAKALRDTAEVTIQLRAEGLHCPASPAVEAEIDRLNELAKAA